MSTRPEQEEHQSAHHCGSASVIRRSSGSRPGLTSCPGEPSAGWLLSWNKYKTREALKCSVGQIILCTHRWIEFRLGLQRVSVIDIALLIFFSVVISGFLVRFCASKGVLPRLIITKQISTDQTKTWKRRITKIRNSFFFFFYLRPSRVRRLASSRAFMRSLRAECWEAWSGWLGWPGSPADDRAEPYRNWASVESIMDTIQFQVGISFSST